MVVYEMCTGKHPYPETTNPLELHELIKAMPSPSLEGIPNLSQEIVDFVFRWYNYSNLFHSFIVFRSNLQRDQLLVNYYHIHLSLGTKIKTQI